MESSFGLINLRIKATLLVTTYMDTGYIPGSMDDATRGHGKVIRCTEKAHLRGKTDVFTQDSIIKIKEKGMVYSPGPTKQDMMEIGQEESRMEQEQS